MGAEVMAYPAARRRLAGHRARGAGAGFETYLVRFIWPPMRARGLLLRADKTDPPMRPIHDADRGRIFVPAGAGGADFVLLVRGGGYAVVECKSTADNRLCRDELTPEQIRHLDAAVKAGGGAYLAVQFRDGPTSTAYLVPWPSVPWSTTRTAPSISPADLTMWRLNSWIDAARIIGAKS